MKAALRAQLSVMMFLEFFIWGSWYTTIGVFMSSHNMGTLTHWPYTVNPVAAIIAPFFVGLIADRYFATQKVLGILHILGAVFMFLVPSATGNSTLFILLLLGYNLCYMPTMSLANTICFHKMSDQEKEFPLIRVFGTVGWIVAGLIISFVLNKFVAANVKPEETGMQLYMTAGASLLLGLFSFTLPNTPPPAKGKKVSAASIIGIDAFKQLASPSFFIFLLSSFLICIPLAAYYNFTQHFLAATGFEKIASTQILGQVSETVFMTLIPFFFIRLGVKKMLAVGMLAWIIRYALFALAAPDQITSLIIIGVVMHGICYDFFFVTGQIYVDKRATPQIRAQAQGLIIFVTYGVGMLVGAPIAGSVYNKFLGTSEHLTLQQWQNFWWIPAGFAAVVLLFFMATFKEKRQTEASL
ncbi:nucleoside permease [Niastella sp. OAS944]|uniref:nucleoside permease n=1 Tax=Niastella sp. OAS944 TaxID=2664089 RepID=UPI00347D17F2|nr:nucleoside transporter [Chitinophagaceae bacterium OAS944]